MWPEYFFGHPYRSLKTTPSPVSHQNVFRHLFWPGVMVITKTTSNKFNRSLPFIQYMKLYPSPPRNPPEIESKVKILKITLLQKSEIYGGGA
jgi:hypothetical protein